MDIPDLLGDEGRLQLVENTLRDLQMQKASVELQQTINGSDSGAAIPGTQLTYGERLTQIDEGIRLLAAEYPDEIDTLRRRLG